MSPSLPAPRREWLWSFPAFAIVLSFLWYRKKRGPKKRDNGSATESEETQDHRISVECEEDEEDDDDDEEENDEEEEEKEEEQQQEQEQVKEPEIEACVVASASNDLKEESQVVAEDIKEETVEDEPVKEPTESEDIFVVRIINSRCSGVVVSDDNNVKCGDSEDMAKKSNETSVVVGDQRQGKKKGGVRGGNNNNNNNNNTTASILEQKLAELDLSSTKCNGNAVEDKPIGEDVAERDSANNSPSEVMLSCPSVSGYSDTHSEGSNDSGKGCSEMLTPSRTPASGNSVSGDIPVTSVYEFEVPQYLVGRLIGSHGSNFHKIKEAANVSLYIKTHPESKELKICAIEGTQIDIDTALDMIRRKFPKKLFPDLSFEQIVIAPEPLMIPLYPGNYQLYLVEGINNDVILSSLVSAGHFFLQQPTHPTFPALSQLDSCMTYCYSQPNQPRIPEGIGAGVLCAATVYDAWYRAQIVEMDENNEFCTLKFVDYGGYMKMSVPLLRQIRADFINLPFQASECYLADIKPANGENDWSLEAKETVEKLTFGNILQAQVHGYAFHGVPLIYLYSVFNNQVILINEELVNRGYAEWIVCEGATEEVQAEEGKMTEERAGFTEIVHTEPVA